ncbi:MAG: hypothetical protein NC229_08720, partial [Bacteroides sp.]|nr:hypothetical protein [Bacteroides sp.]MCM1403809.1 hypothetical protein [Bacteroides sp.]MCM1443539.1 hypothetical protein [Muribaculum sp.]
MVKIKDIIFFIMNKGEILGDNNNYKINVVDVKFCGTEVECRGWCRNEYGGQVRIERSEIERFKR